MCVRILQRKCPLAFNRQTTGHSSITSIVHCYSSVIRNCPSLRQTANRIKHVLRSHDYHRFLSRVLSMRRSVDLKYSTGTIRKTAAIFIIKLRQRTSHKIRQVSHKIFTAPKTLNIVQNEFQIYDRFNSYLSLSF